MATLTETTLVPKAFAVLATNQQIELTVQGNRI